MSRSDRRRSGGDEGRTPPASERDRLDWKENQRRTPEDIDRVDGAFFGGLSGITLLWICLGLGVGGGAIAVAAWRWFPMIFGR